MLLTKDERLKMAIEFVKFNLWYIKDIDQILLLSILGESFLKKVSKGGKE